MHSVLNELSVKLIRRGEDLSTTNGGKYIMPVERQHRLVPHDLLVYQVLLYAVYVQVSVQVEGCSG